MSKKLSLDKMLGGALLAMFRREMGRVASNIFDMNTSPDAKREIVIKLIIKPDADRNIGSVDATVSSKLSPSKSVNGKFLFGLNSITKEGEASEFNADMLGQMSIDDEDAGKETSAKKDSDIIDLRERRMN
jgi:hypothetical protein